MGEWVQRRKIRRRGKTLRVKGWPQKRATARTKARGETALMKLPGQTGNVIQNR